MKAAKWIFNHEALVTLTVE